MDVKEMRIRLEIAHEQLYEIFIEYVLDKKIEEMELIDLIIRQLMIFEEQYMNTGEGANGGVKE